jgi:chromosome partitioning protein
MRRMVVALSKGGVGKSTTAVSLASGLAQAGAQVLLIDTDTQGQVAGMLGVHPRAGLAELLAGEQRPEEAMIEARERLWLLAGGRGLAGSKRLIDRKDFGGERTLGEALMLVEGRYDYVSSTPPLAGTCSASTCCSIRPRFSPPSPLRS